MTPDEWRRVKEVLERALERGPADRGALLDQTCGAEIELRRRVEAMLASDHDMGEFLSQPLVAGDEYDSESSSGGRELPALSAEHTGARRIGPYQILRQVGGGGMGTVHLAE